MGREKRQLIGQKHKFFILTMFLIFLPGALRTASACSCFPNAPCQSFGDADVVFAGKVVGAKQQIKRDDYETINEGKENEKTISKKVAYDVGEIYFEVTEGFNGAEKGSRITIHSSTGGSDCGFWFKRGETYVVFASKEKSNAPSNISSMTYGGAGKPLPPDQSRLWTTLCSGTREIKHAGEALSYLRNLPKPGDGGTIVGRTDETIRNYRTENFYFKPLPNARIKAQQTDGKKQAFFGTSNDNGYYEMKVPPGTYIVTPLLEKNLTFEQDYEDPGEPVKIEDRRCQLKLFKISNDSRISGKVLDAGGKPYGEVMVELIPAGKKKDDNKFDYFFESVSDDGTFTFKRIPLGRYFLSVNFTDKPKDDSPFPTTFYPLKSLQTEAQIIEIDYGTKIGDIIFQLPPKLIKRKISGSVVWKNGKPAAGAEIDLIDMESGDSVYFKRPLSNLKGDFNFEAFEGRKYKIKVIVWKKSPDGQSGYGIADAESEVFTLDAQINPIKIVLEPINPKEKSITTTTVRAN